MQIVPTEGRVVVRRDSSVSKTEGGIILPETAKEKSQRGRIFATSSGRWSFGKFIESTLTSGDIVLFRADAGHELELDGEKLLVMEDTEILAVLKK